MAHFHCKDIDKELLNDVKDEAAEQQDRVEQTILQIEDNQDDEQSLRVLFRCVHNIKGNIGLSGLQPLIPVLHHLEDILGLLRENKIQYQPAIGDLTLLVQTLGHLKRQQNY